MNFCFALFFQFWWLTKTRKREINKISLSRLYFYLSFSILIYLFSAVILFNIHFNKREAYRGDVLFSFSHNTIKAAVSRSKESIFTTVHYTFVLPGWRAQLPAGVIHYFASVCEQKENEPRIKKHHCITNGLTLTPIPCCVFEIDNTRNTSMHTGHLYRLYLHVGSRWRISCVTLGY